MVPFEQPRSIMQTTLGLGEFPWITPLIMLLGCLARRYQAIFWYGFPTKIPWSNVSSHKPQSQVTRAIKSPTLRPTL